MDWMFAGKVLLGSIVLIFVAASVMKSSASWSVHDHHEWLSVLSPTAWTPAFEVSKRMEAKRGSEISMSQMYSHLKKLEREGLVQSRVLPNPNHSVDDEPLLISSYMLTPAGAEHKRGLELENSVPSPLGPHVSTPLVG